MALNEAEMKVGDVVRLNAGGPSMAVESIVYGYARCVWFTQDGLAQRGEFLSCMLVVAPFVDAL